VKSGIASSTGVSAIRKISIGTIIGSTPDRAKPSSAPAAMTANNGAPSTVSASSRRPVRIIRRFPG
jgi:hypothetical protein